MGHGVPAGTPFKEFAIQKGYTYELSADQKKERVIRPDGVLVAERDRNPTVWMRSIRDHRYQGRMHPEGGIFLCHEEEVENIETLKFAVREPPPPRATRTP